ncbi:MAG TPA: thiamine-phosphate kinase [Acidimicrobiales bacterium]|nr:thiamine-phosphate kinase [Acidimicrobiales bacterium]
MAAHRLPGPGAPTPDAPGAAAGPRWGERAAIDLLRATLPVAPPGETWIGDDAAVLDAPAGRRLLLATDCLVDGVHVDLQLSSLADLGWKALAVNVSDVAAMGGTPLAAVVALAGARGPQIEPLYEGLREAATHYGCPIVGGDLCEGPTLVLALAVIGTVDGAPVLRSGARPGDSVFVTGRLGRSAAGLRTLRSRAPDPHGLAIAHRRPSARLLEGQAAARGGANAMIDCSDGLAIDLDRLASASGVGVDLEEVPVAQGATLEEALGGGEDYELVFAAADAGRIAASFAAAGLVEPIEIGRCVADSGSRTLAGRPFEIVGFEHRT